MLKKDVDDMIACLPKGRTGFYYRKGLYAPLLLMEHVGQGMPVRQIKSGPMAPLLNHPTVKPLLAAAGDGVLRPEHLWPAWWETTDEYPLTLDTWGAPDNEAWNPWHYQTSRPGLNLVLQVNFPDPQIRLFRRLMGQKDGALFTYSGHPNSRRGGTLTMGWARLDVNLDGDEVLIEEIQSDWFSIYADLKKYLRRFGTIEKGLGKMSWGHCRAKRVWSYLHRVMPPLDRRWQETVMAATLWFIRYELGVRRVYFHTFESGQRIKKQDWSTPPRSVYTDLPRKFCFRRTETGPRFLERQQRAHLRRLRRRKPLEWFLLD